MDLTVEEGQRLKVIFGSHTGFHVIDVDSGNSYDIYIPSHVSTQGSAAAWLMPVTSKVWTSPWWLRNGDQSGDILPRV